MRTSARLEKIIDKICETPEVHVDVVNIEAEVQAVIQRVWRLLHLGYIVLILFAADSRPFWLLLPLSWFAYLEPPSWESLPYRMQGLRNATNIKGVGYALRERRLRPSPSNEQSQ
jgi:hypothetical protein